MCGLLLYLFRKVLCLWLISFERPLALCVMVKIWTRSCCLPAFDCDRARFNFPSGLSNIGLSVKWLWRFFVESLSRPSMIKLVEQVQTEIGSCIHSRDVLFHYGFTHCFFTSMVLIAIGNTGVFLLGPIKVMASFKNDASM